MDIGRLAAALGMLLLVGSAVQGLGCDGSMDGGADSDSDTDTDGDADGDTDSSDGVDPVDSPYHDAGPYAVEELSTTGMSPTDVLLFRPTDTTSAPYPTVLFQVGANAVGTTYIDIHSKDLFWERAHVVRRRRRHIGSAHGVHQ